EVGGILFQSSSHRLWICVDVIPFNRRPSWSETGYCCTNSWLRYVLAYSKCFPSHVSWSQLLTNELALLVYGNLVISHGNRLADSTVLAVKAHHGVRCSA